MRRWQPRSLLIAAKVVAYLLTDSVSLLSTLLDSLLDAAASLINLLAVRHALTPADREHRFGHGKAEPLAALGPIGLHRRLGRLPDRAGGQPPGIAAPGDEHRPSGWASWSFRSRRRCVLVLFQRFVIRRTGSLAINADSLHYASDLIVNASVVVALILVAVYGWQRVDPVFGAGIALYIIYTAWQIARSALDMLMDRELPDEERQRIRAIALANPGVRAVHDLRTRAAGQTMFVQMHLEVDGKLSLAEAHTIADAVEEQIHAAYPGAEIIIHEDPAGIVEARPVYR